MCERPRFEYVQEQSLSRGFAKAVFDPLLFCHLHASFGGGLFSAIPPGKDVKKYELSFIVYVDSDISRIRAMLECFSKRSLLKQRMVPNKSGITDRYLCFAHLKAYTGAQRGLNWNINYIRNRKQIIFANRLQEYKDICTPKYSEYPQQSEQSTIS